jgi:hypothetical protein
MAGVLLCYTFYRVQLVPRALAVWGLAGYAIHFGGAAMEILGFNLGFIPVIPGGLWELFIGVWLIVKGFSSSPVPLERTTSSMPIVTAPKLGSAAA